MATKEKSSRHRKNYINTTFSSSLDSTTVETKSLNQTEEDEDNDNDGPVVFICAKCRLPVGDSLSWDGSEAGQNQIRLKRESHI